MTLIDQLSSFAVNTRFDGLPVEVVDETKRLILDSVGCALAAIEQARGSTFVAERLYPKGSPSPDPATRMTTEEIIVKLQHNANGVLSDRDVDSAVDAIMELETVSNFSTVMQHVAKSTRIEHG